jgi:hypothetical protein
VSEQSRQRGDSDLATAGGEIDEENLEGLIGGESIWLELAGAALLLGVPAGLIYLAAADTPSGWIKWPVLIGAGWIGLALLLAVTLGLVAGYERLRDRRRQ